jgi:hypothetical protein
LGIRGADNEDTTASRAQGCVAVARDGVALKGSRASGYLVVYSCFTVVLYMGVMDLKAPTLYVAPYPIPVVVVDVRVEHAIGIDGFDASCRCFASGGVIRAVMIQLGVAYYESFPGSPYALILVVMAPYILHQEVSPRATDTAPAIWLAAIVVHGAADVETPNGSVVGLGGDVEAVLGRGGHAWARVVRVDSLPHITPAHDYGSGDEVVTVVDVEYSASPIGSRHVRKIVAWVHLYHTTIGRGRLVRRRHMFAGLTYAVGVGGVLVAIVLIEAAVRYQIR